MHRAVLAEWKVRATVPSDGGKPRGVMRRCPAKVEPIGPHVFLWTGLDQGCLRNHFGGATDLNFEGKHVILRIYGF